MSIHKRRKNICSNVHRSLLMLITLYNAKILILTWGFQAVCLISIKQHLLIPIANTISVMPIFVMKKYRLLHSAFRRFNFINLCFSLERKDIHNAHSPPHLNFTLSSMEKIKKYKEYKCTREKRKRTNSLNRQEWEYIQTMQLISTIPHAHYMNSMLSIVFLIIFQT